MLKTVLVVREMSGDSSLGATYWDMAFLHQKMGEYREALEMYKKALPILQKEDGAGHTIVATTQPHIDECQLHLK